MEKLARFLIVVLLPFFAISQSRDKQESTFLKIKSGEDIITYEFHSIQDFEENSEKIFDEIPTENLSNKKEKHPNLTIEISITITSADESRTISGSVTSSSQTIITAIKKLRKQLIIIASE